jgi:hypothetical protein
LRWSYSGCPDGLAWIDDVGASANPVHAFDRGGQLTVFVELPTIIQYRAGRSGSGVQRFDQGGSVRLRVHSRCRWEVVAWPSERRGHEPAGGLLRSWTWDPRIF